MAELPPKLIDALADRYALQHEIGAGGMATVYLADDLKHNRRVAVKVLRPDLAAALGSERFLREIEIAAGLTHPHILPLHDSGDEDGFLYYVMPFIDGESLRERLTREGQLPVPDAIRIFRQVVDALGEAHTHDVVHRDVKPENVLLTGGHALMADFGVARAISEATQHQKLTTAGVALGTPQYMAPEQATADPTLDHRADLFAAGAIAYELLTGVAPFAADNTRAVLTAIMTRNPEPPNALRPAVPEALSDLVMSCLEKEAADRPQTAGEVVSRLDAIATPVGGVAATNMLSTRRGKRALAAAAVAAVVLGSAAAWRWNAEQSSIAWARGEAIPEVIRLLGENQISEAAHLAVEAEAILGLDPVLDPLRPRLTSTFRITTEPAGATISYRLYESDDAWELLGTTPFESDRFPIGAFRFRIEAEGYEPIEKVRSLIPANQLAEHVNAGYDYLQDASYVIDVALVPEGSMPDGMVAVPGGLYGTVPIIGFTSIQPMPIPEYLIQRTEVTVGAYREFVEAGGYEDRALWPEPFIRDGVAISWEEAVDSFQDATGRPGPATWSLGQPEPGSELLPVGGISWFEAAAYCRWRGLALPTLFHWARAALPSSDVWIPFNSVLAARSNFNGGGPAPVTSRDALGISGAHDLAGNVREWVATSSRDLKYLAGGGWSDPVYWIHDMFPTDPWGRDPVNGVRCASFPGGDLPQHLQAPLEAPTQDFDRPTGPLPQAVFDTRRAFYTYDRSAPLSTTIDSSTVLDWGATEEWVTIDAAYGERMPIRLHVPLGHEPPYEAIVFFGGGNVIRSSEMEDPQPPLDDLVRSGRVLVEPAYDGTFQRNVGRTVQRLAPGSREQLFGNWIKDLGRTLDYLDERPDVDHTRVSFLGLSLGSAIVPNLLAFEPRFRTAVLYSGGFGAMEPQPSIDDRSGLAGRMEMPILMLGGRNDFNSPIDPHQEAFFRAFGTPDEHKHFRVYDSGHWPLPMNEVLRETVDFLDRYAGTESR